MSNHHASQDSVVTAASTSRRGEHTLLAGFLAGIFACLLALPVPAQSDSLQRAMERYQAGEYRQSVEILELLVNTSPSSDAYHWLGKAYGKLAEQAALLRALELARKTRMALEKAVALDDSNRAALKDLLKFHEQAPAIAGGSKKQAAILKERLTAMDPDDESGNDLRYRELSDS